MLCVCVLCAFRCVLTQLDIVQRHWVPLGQSSREPRLGVDTATRWWHCLGTYSLWLAVLRLTPGFPRRTYGVVTMPLSLGGGKLQLPALHRGMATALSYLTGPFMCWVASGATASKPSVTFTAVMTRGDLGH